MLIDTLGHFHNLNAFNSIYNRSTEVSFLYEEAPSVVR
jgi:hypothetical protein